MFRVPFDVAAAEDVQGKTTTHAMHIASTQAEGRTMAQERVFENAMGNEAFI
jgi:hypothetical protein